MGHLVETTKVEEGEGIGALVMTGQLGDVMKESAQIAHTVSRAILREIESRIINFLQTQSCTYMFLQGPPLRMDLVLDVP
jgi:Lon-like ATP-dependent protease